MSIALPDRIISADDHMDVNVLPVDVFTARVPHALRDAVPHVVDTDDGPMWSIGGAPVGPSGRRAKGLVTQGDLGFRPGLPDARLSDMDRDGVYCQVVYGPPLGLPVPDVEVRAQCMRAYNDWAAEFNAVSPNRLVVLALLPGHTPDAARAELERAAALGHRGAMLGAFDAADPPFEEPWEPFWAAANEIGAPISFHLGAGLHSIKVRPGSWRMTAGVAVAPLQLDEVLAGMILSGLLERYPNVRVVLGEAGLGWVPYVLERLDHEHRKYRDVVNDVVLREPPREYFRRQVFLTYEEDHLGLELLHHVGATNVMWASDYPHGDSTWPHSLDAIRASGLRTLTEQDRRLILWDNAAALYGIV
ncbi:MAG TPA: amidohydrolase family protein [Acidimicrobiales bacterium]|nr:amidohydrolase family protein [Acidimicrobiales bacterium]